MSQACFADFDESALRESIRVFEQHPLCEWLNLQGDFIEKECKLA